MSSLVLPWEFPGQFKEGSIWSEFYPLKTSLRLEENGRKDPILKAPGIYQVFMRTEWEVYSFYIGMSENLRRRIGDIQGAFGTRMPYSDPHTAGPALYAWRHKKPGAMFQVAVAPFESSIYVRRAIEDFMIAHERWKQKRSPLAQFGRMPRRWRSSSGNTRHLMVLGKRYRGGPTRQRDQSHLVGIAPRADLYADTTDPLGLDWAGYPWTPWYDPSTLPHLGKVEGLYRLRRQGQGELFLIGCGQIQRAVEKARKLSPLMCVSSTVGGWPDHQLQEQVCDLIGLYMRQKASIPLMQYGGEASARPRDPLPLLTLLETIISQLSWPGYGFPRLVVEPPQMLLPVGSFRSLT